MIIKGYLTQIKDDRINIYIYKTKRDTLYIPLYEYTYI